MVAEFKSHILRREEKGFAGVPFKRLMLAGVGGGITYTLGKFALPDTALPVALVVGLLLVVMTAPRGGIPRWQRMLYRLRGSLILAAAIRPASLPGQIAHLLEVSPALARLDGTALFAPQITVVQADLAEWITFAQAADADHDDGLRFVEARP